MIMMSNMKLLSNIDNELRSSKQFYCEPAAKSCDAWTQSRDTRCKSWPSQLFGPCCEKGDGNVIFSQLEMARQAKRSAVQNCRYDETNSNHLIIAASHKGSTIHPFDLFNQQDAKVLSFLRIIILCSEFLLFCLECRFALLVNILFRSELFFSSNVETLWLQLSFQGPQSCSRVCCHQKIWGSIEELNWDKGKELLFLMLRLHIDIYYAGRDNLSSWQSWISKT